EKKEILKTNFKIQNEHWQRTNPYKGKAINWIMVIKSDLFSDC
ncbi:MAG: hypothetical protein RL607_1882, partial [Bacteroidota bacterium]